MQNHDFLSEFKFVNKDKNKNEHGFPSVCLGGGVNENWEILIEPTGSHITIISWFGYLNLLAIVMYKELYKCYENVYWFRAGEEFAGCLFLLQSENHEME